MAARKRKKVRTGPANPSTPLIIFLVFFVLLSLGLGGWTFSILKKIDERDKKIKELETAAQKDTELKKWYRLQALWSKSVAGEPLVEVQGSVNEPSELKTYMEEYQQDRFNNMEGYKAFQQMVERDLKNLGGQFDPKTKKYANWDDNNKRLKSDHTYRSQWQLAVKEKDNLLDQVKQLQGEKDALVKADAKRKQEETKDWNDLKGAVVAKNNELEAKKDQYEKDVKKVIANLQDAGKGMEETVNKIRADYNALSAEQVKKLKDKDEEIAKLRATQSRMQEQSAKAVKTSQADLLSKDTPKGKVIRVDYTGTMPYLNLGSADGAKEALTFSIYGQSASGKVDKDPKGTLEIARVIGPHLSQARVITLRDASFNPVQEGDLVFNPAWDPGRKTHVAIAGIIDFSGNSASATLSEQERNLREFINTLERQNIVVDAYLDLRDQKIRGPGISLNTDYLILGAGPSYEGFRILDTKDEKVNVKAKIEDLIKSMRDEAIKKGVALIPLNKFALLTGYRVPRGSAIASSGGGSYEEPQQPAAEKAPAKEERLGEKKEGPGLKKDDKGDKDDADMKKKDKKNEDS